jgi:beta-xylosidase
LLRTAFLALTAFASIGAADPAFVPVLNENFPDPFVLADGDGFLAYATNADRGGPNVQVARSSDLRSWTRLDKHDAMPALPSWAKRGFTWAPEIVKAGNRYVLYFTARHRESDQQCVGAAVSADPLGPFVDAGDKPLVCQHKLGGTIDASPFRDADGKLYLYFKNDGNDDSARTETWLWGQRLSADGLRLEGDPVKLLTNDRPWEGIVVEAPTMVRGPGGYTMLFSANDFAWQPRDRLSRYAMGYASCQGPLGPCTDAPENPILHSYNHREMGCLSGPGHQTLFEVAGRQFLVFHAWAATAGCRDMNRGRYMYIAPLLWDGGKPKLAKSLRPQGKQ